MTSGLVFVPVRTRLLLAMLNDRGLIRAISMAIKFKQSVRTGTAKNLNHIHKMTGVSYGAANKYCKKLEAYGLLRRCGKDNSMTVFGKLRSSNSEKNLKVKIIDLSSIKQIEVSLRSMLIVLIQSQKDFVRRSALALTSPRSLSEYKKARKQLRSRPGYKYGVFTENGYSYMGIAKKLGISIATAFKDVKNAVQNFFIQKKRNIVQLFLGNKSISMRNNYNQQFQSLSSPTFIYKGNAYYVHANTYIIHPHILSLLHGNN